MHEVTFLQDLAIVMIVAGAVTILCHLLKQPVVLGYIVAGVIIGPHTPPFPLISDQTAIRTLSELGVIFIMFSLGLEFNLRRLRAVGASALIAALSAIVLMLWAGYQLGGAFGWSAMDRIFLGAILSISSTTIVVRALEELGKTKERFASLILGILIVEDILAILMIAILSSFATTGEFSSAQVGMTLVRLGSFLAVLMILGLLIVPRLIDFVARFKSQEMLLISVLGLCFGVSLLATKLNYSVALGAFLIGAIIAEARQIMRVEAIMKPVRDMFSAVFFVSIGLLIDPRLLVQHALPIALITLLVIVGQAAACAFGTLLAGNDLRTSLRVGMGLAQIGEFSFIIASLGLTLGVTSDFLYPIAVAVSALTTLTLPYLIRSSDAVIDLIGRLVPRPVLNYVDVYTKWVGGFHAESRRSFAFGLIRKWTWQIGLNIILVTAIFIGASFLRRYAMSWDAQIPGGDNAVKALLWIGAVILSLPMLVAAVRKMQALTTLFAELSVPRNAAGEQTAVVRSVISGTILAVACFILLLLMLLLSAAILPSRNVFVVLLLITVAAVILFRRSAIRVYARAQYALQQTFAQTAETPAAVPAPLVAGLLENAQLRTVQLPPGSSAAGKLIGELQLRSMTGATVVGIQRAESKVINPGPDEELQAGDQILLLGGDAELSAALKLLSVDAAAPAPP